MNEIIRQGLIHQFEVRPDLRGRMAELELEVLEGRMTSFRAARTLLELYLNPTKGKSER